jgi:hypothetical protein
MILRPPSPLPLDDPNKDIRAGLIQPAHICMRIKQLSFVGQHTHKNGWTYLKYKLDDL